jgi:hypothetical protein
LAIIKDGFHWPMTHHLTRRRRSRFAGRMPKSLFIICAVTMSKMPMRQIADWY